MQPPEEAIDALVAEWVRKADLDFQTVVRLVDEEAFRDIVGSRFEKRVTVDYVFQSLEDIPPRFTVPAGRSKPWGTTQAVLAGASAVREPFAAINADDFYGAESFRVIAGHLKSGSPDYAMVGFILRNTLSEFGTVARGVCELVDGNYLKGIVEYLAIGRDGESVRNVDASGTVTHFTGNEPVSLNFWGFTPSIFDQLRESFETFLEQNGSDLKRECLLPTTVNDLVAAGKARVKVLPAEGSWFGVTYREDRPRVVESIRALVAAGAYPEKLWP